MASMVVMAGPERRRRWSEDQKRAILAAADEPGANISEVARRADICTSLIYRWRQLRQVSAGFVPAVLVDDPPAPAQGAGIGSMAIVVDLAGVGRVSIGSCAPAALVTAALRALR
jgi:transposase